MPKSVSRPSFDDWRKRADSLNLREKTNQLVGPCPLSGDGDDRFSVSAENAVVFCRCKCGEGPPTSQTSQGRACYRKILQAAGLAPKRGPKKVRSRDPDHIWQFEDANGKPIVEERRWDLEDGDKDVRPFVPGATRPGLPARLKRKGSRPLYRLPAILQDAESWVIVVEGPKTADAVTTALKGRGIVTTSIGGSGAARFTDWTPLTQRDVIIWPDADEDGHKYAQVIVSFLPDARVVDVSDLPHGWDLADKPPPGLDVIQRLRDAKTVERVPFSDMTDLGLGTDQTGVAEEWIRQADGEWRCLLSGTSDTGKWHRWDGTRHRPVSLSDAQASVHDLAGKMAQGALIAGEGASNVRGYARTMRSKAFAADATKISGWLSHGNLEDYDAETDLLNTPGGVLDLRDNELEPHDKSMLHTKIAGAAPSSEPCHLWRQCLRDWTEDDPDLMEYLQRIVGYSLFGHNHEHAVIEFYGSGGNGKGVFTTVWMRLLGDYAKPISYRVLATKSGGDEHPTALASLLGARLAVVPELPVGVRFDEERLKAVSGGDRLAARFMRQDYFEFTPVCLPLIVGNDQPATQDVGASMRRRLHIVPWQAQWGGESGKRPDTRLTEKLLTELPAIMGWAVEGLAAYRERGLQRPAAVEEATSDYFEEQDRIGRYLEEMTVRVDDSHGKAAVESRISTSDIYNDYKRWLDENGDSYPESPKRFTQEMKKRRYGSGRHAGRRVYFGIAWRPGAEPKDF